MSENATAIAYINNMGGSSFITCHKIANQIWEWAKMQQFNLNHPYTWAKEY